MVSILSNQHVIDHDENDDDGKDDDDDVRDDEDEDDDYANGEIIKGETSQDL